MSSKNKLLKITQIYFMDITINSYLHYIYFAVKLKIMFHSITLKIRFPQDQWRFLVGAMVAMTPTLFLKKIIMKITKIPLIYLDILALAPRLP